MFAAHVLLAYHYNLRMVWFPGCCHQEDNIDKGTMEASGFSHLKEKVSHLGKFNHAPYKGGKWLGQQKMAADAFLEAVRAHEPVASSLFDSSVADICADQGWPGPETQQARDQSFLDEIFVFRGGQRCMSVGN